MRLKSVWVIKQTMNQKNNKFGLKIQNGFNKGF
jgi:hypothetical protein